MKQKRRREFHKEGSALSEKLSAHASKSTEAPSWPPERFRFLPLISLALIALCTVIIYGQTLRVPGCAASHTASKVADRSVRST